MQAVRLYGTSGPESLSVDDVAVSRPQAGEVLVRIRAAALNHRDLFITRGLYPNVALPAILGSDGAGEVAALGAGVSGFDVGAEVVIDPMLGWGEDPAVWQPEATILGMPRAGTLAEYVSVPAVNLHAKPCALTMEEAAAIPLCGLTAFHALFFRGNLRAGETVLIPGIGGGVQTFALSFAKRAGARAIVTSHSDEKLQRALELGADLAFNYAKNPDWQKEVKAAGPIDLAIDSSGGDTLAKIVSALRPGGRIVVYGGTRPDATIKLFPLFWNHLTILGSSMGSPQDFRAMLALFEGGLKPVIDRVYAMRDVVEAFRRMDASEQFGKIVLSWRA
jgi:zinc-binding alcohol dehydrogenase/oxidoreductase